MNEEQAKTARAALGSLRQVATEGSELAARLDAIEELLPVRDEKPLWRISGETISSQPGTVWFDLSFGETCDPVARRAVADVVSWLRDWLEKPVVGDEELLARLRSVGAGEELES